MAIAVHIAGPTRAGTFYALSLGFNELKQADGTTEFSLAMFMSVAPPTGRLETLTSPSGQKFIGPYAVAENIASWADLSGLIFGQWTFESASQSNPLDIETYTFSVSPFSYQSLSAPFPQITPAHLSSVSSPFVVSWTPAAIGSRGIGSSGGVTNLAVKELHPSAIEVTFDDIQSEGATLEFFVGTTTEFLPQISKPSGPRVSPRYDMHTFLYYSRTSQATYFAVPEPQREVVLALALVAMPIAVRKFAAKEQGR